MPDSTYIVTGCTSHPPVDWISCATSDRTKAVDFIEKIKSVMINCGFSFEDTPQSGRFLFLAPENISIDARRHLVDIVRAVDPKCTAYSWVDYRIEEVDTLP